MVGDAVRSARMKQIASFTQKQAQTVEALAVLEGDGLAPASIRELVACVADGGGTRNWIGTDTGGMRQTLHHLLARGIVERVEQQRVRTRDPRWRWRLTRKGWDALMHYYDETWG